MLTQPALPPSTVLLPSQGLTPVPPPTYAGLVSTGFEIVKKAGLVWTTTMLSHSVLAPALAKWMTGRVTHHTWGEHLMVMGAMAMASLAVVVGPSPGGHLVQRSDLKTGRRFSWRTLVSGAFDASLATLSQVAIAAAYGQNLGLAFQNGLTRGVTRSVLPFSFIYKSWGDRQMRAIIVRQIANSFLMVNATALTSILSQKPYKSLLGNWSQPFCIAEISIVSVLMYLAISHPRVLKYIGPVAQVPNR